jgi:ABC-type phosphate transport system substrate-binding protein
MRFRGNSPMHTKQTRVCPKCYHNANPLSARHCEICAYTFQEVVKVTVDEKAAEDAEKVAKHVPQSETMATSSRWLFLALIPLLLGGSYTLLWKNQQSIGAPRDTASASVASTASVPTVTSTVSPPQSTGVQLHPLMREVQNVPKGLFNYAGAVTFASLHSQAMRTAISQAYPDFRLRYTEPLGSKPGSTAGINMLLNSEISFAQSARPLEDEEYSKAKARNLVLEQIPVAIDGVAFYAHPKIPVSGLSIDQLQSIFLGKVTNWKQVGGPNLPIVPVSLDPKLVSMINLLLGDNKKQGLGKNVQIVRDVTAAVRKVASTPGAIGYASASEVARQQTIHPLAMARAGSKQYVKPVLDKSRINVEAFQDGSYPLTRRLFVVTRRDGTLDEQAGIAYTNLLLSSEGQQLIERAGFVAIR